jgi:hypothetical protein
LSHNQHHHHSAQPSPLLSTPRQALFLWSSQQAFHSHLDQKWYISWTIVQDFTFFTLTRWESFS